jgi:DNA transposition AAA+ family ATPase
MMYDPDTELLREQILKLLDRREAQGHPLHQNDIAKAIGLSGATVSNFLNRKDSGDVKKTAAKLKGWLVRELAREEGGLQALPFAETRPAKEGLKHIEFLSHFNRFGVLYGDSGLGKTYLIAEAMRRDPTMIVLTAWKGIGRSGILRELCGSLKEAEGGTQYAMMKRIKAKLCPGGKSAGRCIIVDDAHTLAFDALDTLRHIFDQTGTGLALIGIGAVLRPKLETPAPDMEQIASRASGRTWKLPEIDESDFELMLGGVMAEQDIEPALKIMRERDPQLLASPRRMGNLVEIACRIAKKSGAPTVMIEHIQKALKYAA